MRAVVQRVSRAAVRDVTTGEVLGHLGPGAEGQKVEGQPAGHQPVASPSAASQPPASQSGNQPPAASPPADPPPARDHGGGLCVLLGVGHGDTRAEADWLADKVCGLRIFSDPPDPDPELTRKRLGNMNRSLREVGGALLVISQFTLYADTSRGRRPSFTGAMPPAEAEALYEYFVATLRRQGFRVATGRFGAMMAVELVNEGPVTIWLDSRDLNKGKPAEPARPTATGEGG